MAPSFRRSTRTKIAPTRLGIFVANSKDALRAQVRNATMGATTTTSATAIEVAVKADELDKQSRAGVRRQEKIGERIPDGVPTQTTWRHISHSGPERRGAVRTRQASHNKYFDMLDRVEDCTTTKQLARIQCEIGNYWINSIKKRARLSYTHEERGDIGMKWLQISALNESIDALHVLGNMYRFGCRKVCPVSDPDSEEYFNEAKRLGA